MAALGILGLMGVALVCMYLVTQLPLRRRGFRPSHAPPEYAVGYTFDPSSSREFVVGAQVQSFRASQGLATLTVDAHWAWLTGVPEVWVDRTVVTRVRLAKGWLGYSLHFDSADGSFDGVLVDGPVSAIADELRRLGWPVGGENGITAPS